MTRTTPLRSLATLCFAALFQPLACLTPPPLSSAADGTAADGAAASEVPPLEAMQRLDAWTAARQMGIRINIGNTLDNTTKWETGWGNPPITKEYVEHLAALGFKTVRLPVAWDTYAAPTPPHTTADPSAKLPRPTLVLLTA